METKILKDTCIPLSIAALLRVARTWKQHRCSLTDEWMKKLWYIHTKEYYSIIKKNTFESVLMRWMNLEPIIQCEVSHKEKYQYSILIIYMEFRKIVMMTPICETAKETQMQRRGFWTQWEKARVRCFERIALEHVYYHM